MRGRQVAAGGIETNGIAASEAQPKTSSSDFGHLLPEKSPHRQTGDLRKAKTLYAILQDQRYKCSLSGIDLAPETAVLDHIIPVSKGGHPTDARNGHFVHRAVNTLKGTMDLGELVFWVKSQFIHG